MQEKQHITEQSPVPDRKGQDEHFEVVGLQAVNAGVVSVSQDHSTGQCEDDPSPVTAASNCDLISQWMISRHLCQNTPRHFPYRIGRMSILK